METQTLINGGFALFGGLAGYILNTMHQAMRDLQKADTALTEKVQHIEVLVAGSYVKKDDLDKMVDALFTKLDRIESKLENKADK